MSQYLFLHCDDPDPFIKALLQGYGSVDLEQLKFASLFKFLYLAFFVVKYEDFLKGETLEQLIGRYLGYFKKLEGM